MNNETKNFIKNIDPKILASVLLSINETNGKLKVLRDFSPETKNKRKLDFKIRFMSKILQNQYKNKHDEMYKRLSAEVSRIHELYNVNKNLEDLNFLINKLNSISKIEMPTYQQQIYMTVLNQIQTRLKEIMNIKEKFKEKHYEHVKNRLDQLYSDYFEVIRSNLDPHRRYGVMLQRMILSGEIQIPKATFNKLQTVKGRKDRSDSNTSK